MLLLCQFEAACWGVAVDRDGPRGARRSAGGDRGLGVGLGQVPDAPGELALEAADGLPASLALGLSAGEVGGGLRVQAAFDDGEAVEGAVELAGSAAGEGVAVRAPRGGGGRGRGGGGGGRWGGGGAGGGRGIAPHP